MSLSERTKEWIVKRFSIPEEDILWYSSGTCYDRIGVKTKESADKVTAAVQGETVNGGHLHGMQLGFQTPCQDGIDVMC